MDFLDLDATAQAELVRERKASPEDLTLSAIARIEQLNPSVNAVVTPLFDEALDFARSDRLPKGPFSGVPTLMKDMSAAVKGMPSYHGNRILKEMDHRAPADTPVGRRVADAGFVVLGKTNTPEFGLQPTTQPFSFGPTRNPWDTTRSPSGSSGGSAAAVAAGMVAIAHASDGGGSIRNPASWCGLVGMKPSRGRVPRGAAVGRLGQELFVTRSVRDTALGLDALATHEYGDLFSMTKREESWTTELGAPTGQLRIGLMTNVDMDIELDQATSDAARMTAKRLESLGHFVDESHPERMFDDDFQHNAETDYSCALNATINALWASVGREVVEQDFEPYSWARMMRHRQTLASEHVRASGWLQRYAIRIARWFDNHDVLLCPTSGRVPMKLEDLVPTSDEPFWIDRNVFASVRCFARPFNVTGHPAISLPLGWTDDGLPVGVQLIGDMGREDTLLRVASQLEKAEPWASRQLELIKRL